MGAKRERELKETPPVEVSTPEMSDEQKKKSEKFEHEAYLGKVTTDLLSKMVGKKIEERELKDKVDPIDLSAMTKKTMTELDDHMNNKRKAEVKVEEEPKKEAKGERALKETPPVE